MSTRIGTLQGSRAWSIWPAAIAAPLVVLMIAVAAVSLGRGQAQQDPKAVSSGVEETFVGGTAANTPTELSGGIVGGATADDLRITAGSSSIAVAGTADVVAAIIAARNAAESDSNDLSGETTGNTPSELSGGYGPDAFDRDHQQR